MAQDILKALAEIDCGGHCDMLCFAENGSHVEWIAELNRRFTESEVLHILDAACCAKACGIRPPNP